VPRHTVTNVATATRTATFRKRSLGVILAIALLLALAPAAGATLRVESSVKGGLVMTDVNGTFRDEVILELISTNQGLKWRVVKFINCGSGCLDLIRFEFGPGCRKIDDRTAECDRLAARVTANLAGGNDNFFPATTGLPITDPLAINGSGGDDQLFGASGADTINGGSGADEVEARDGNDAVNGGSGPDLLLGQNGDDTLAGSVGDDRIGLGLGADSADGDDGNDQFGLGTAVRDGKDHVNGGLGGDTASYSTDFGETPVGRNTELRIIEANLETLAGDKDEPENDVLRSIDSYAGGLDEDIITGTLSSNPSDYLGKNDDDTIFGSSGANTLVGGAGGDSLDGNAGDDTLDAKAGEGSTADADPVIDCGAGTNDFAVIDLLDDASPSGCEALNRSPAREGPHVRIRVPRVVRVRRGRVAFRLTCPRRLRRRCAGTLRLSKGRRRTRATRYSIRPRRSRRVRVRLGRLNRRIGRRTVARLVSRERGRRGIKTTQRRVVLRRRR
jgi:Ca2+-binding RTX toxin-like protein